MGTNLLGDERYLHYQKITLMLALYNQEGPWPPPPHLSSKFFLSLWNLLGCFLASPLVAT
jgi:hypothetical protein